MQAIRTKHVPATDTKPARIQAKCEARTIYISSYPDDLDSIEQRHSYAAAQLVRKMGWHPPHGRYISRYPSRAQRGIADANSKTRHIGVQEQ